MVLAGTVTNGTILLDQPQVFPEGTRVEVVLKPLDDQPQSLRDVLLDSAGCMTDLPSDFAQQHDYSISRADKEWSLTDCISFVVMRKEGAAEALTRDHHFEQAGLVALLE